ncbi:MAG: RIP metalloprotease RseP [Flavobacteriales bacterium]|jgi:regulator of sigma E protease|nr:RIP metalloprotease RseP [Flavobacteriales bacterium]
MEILIKGAQLILSLSILVTLHELGHYLPARWFKTRVEKFYLFFDPWFSLAKKKIGDTEFGIGWIPFGGYVKISGMVDESMDKAQMAKPAEPWEFRSKPAWQRLIIMVGGVTVNLLLGMLIYIGILWVWGRDYLPNENAIYGVHVSKSLEAQGMRDGDRIISVDGKAPKSVGEAQSAIMLDDARELVIGRDGEEVRISLPAGFSQMAVDSGERSLLDARIPFYLDTIVPGSGAARSVLRNGDRIVSVDGVATPFFFDFKKRIATRKEGFAVVGYERGGLRDMAVVGVDKRGTIGVKPKAYDALVKLGYGFNTVHEDFSFLQSIPAGISSGIETLGGYVSSLKFLFSRSGAEQIGGFGAIGGLFSPTWDWQVFWSMTAFLSIILAFMNILPIPALDGGHVVFLLYEMVTGRPPHQRVLEVAQMIGMVLLLGLILFANGNDLLKAIFN